MGPHEIYNVVWEIDNEQTNAIYNLISKGKKAIKKDQGINYKKMGL